VAASCLGVFGDGTLGDVVCTQSRPALCERVPASCLEIKRANPTLTGVGVYYIDPQGGRPPTRVICDMSTDGGGWTLGIVKNSMHVPAGGEYVNLGAVYANASQLATSPFAASSSTTPVAASMNLNAFPFTDLRVGSYADGFLTYLSAKIPRAAMRINFGQSGYYFYRETTRLYWCGGASSFTDDGIGQVNKPIGATDDCKGHTLLGSGWDFSGDYDKTNKGLSMTGVDGGGVMQATAGGPLIPYGTPKATQAVWVR
jgi:hypothetical protein